MHGLVEEETSINGPNPTDGYTHCQTAYAEKEEHTLDLYLEACIESTAHLLPLQDLAREFSVGVDYLGQLARKGKIEATKRGQYWYATKEAVQRYLAEAETQPRGRPRKDH